MLTSEIGQPDNTQTRPYVTTPAPLQTEKKCGTPVLSSRIEGWEAYRAWKKAWKSDPVLGKHNSVHAFLGGLDEFVNQEFATNFMEAHVRIETLLQYMCGLQRRVAIKAMQKAEAAGYIQVVRRANKTNSYYMSIPANPLFGSKSYPQASALASAPREPESYPQPSAPGCTPGVHSESARSALASAPEDRRYTEDKKGSYSQSAKKEKNQESAATKSPQRSEDTMQQSELPKINLNALSKLDDEELRKVCIAAGVTTAGRLRKPLEDALRAKYKPPIEKPLNGHRQDWTGTAAKRRIEDEQRQAAADQAEENLAKLAGLVAAAGLTKKNGAKHPAATQSTSEGEQMVWDVQAKKALLGKHYKPEWTDEELEEKFEALRQSQH